MMKTFLVLSLVVTGIFLSTGSTAFAWYGGHFGFYITPPPLVAGSPPVSLRGYDGPDYYSGPSRYWVPGHWERGWTLYGWRRAWVPGHWQ